MKQLKRDDRRDAAASVANLRRPAWTDWALNVTAAEHPDAVDAFAEAAATVRDAQAAAIEARSGTDLRPALRQLRERSSELARRAAEVLTRGGRSPDTAELATRLVQVAADAAEVEQLRSGTLRDHGAGEAELFTGLEPPPRRPAAKRKPARPDDPAPPATERRRLESEVDDAERAHRPTARELARAEQELDREARAVDAASAALAAANDDLRRAEQRRSEADAQLAALRRQLADRERSVARARAALARADPPEP